MHKTTSICHNPNKTEAFNNLHVHVLLIIFFFRYFCEGQDNSRGLSSDTSHHFLCFYIFFSSHHVPTNLNCLAFYLLMIKLINNIFPFSFFSSEI